MNKNKIISNLINENQNLKAVLQKTSEIALNRVVYLVVEEYGYDGHYEYTTTAFSTREKAKEFFNQKVENEMTSSWIRDMEDSAICHYNENELYFHVYDDINFDETTIYVEEKEIL